MSKMQKTIKTMLAFVAGAMALSACSSDELFELEQNSSAGNLTFTASFELQTCGQLHH